jgi:hypothetical protein
MPPPSSKSKTGPCKKADKADAGDTFLRNVGELLAGLRSVLFVVTAVKTSHPACYVGAFRCTCSVETLDFVSPETMFAAMHEADNEPSLSLRHRLKIVVFSMQFS